MEKPKTQLEAVKYTLRTAGSITSWEAYRDWGITRLAEYIRVLRNEEKWTIPGEDVTEKNRFGHPVTFSRYVYEAEPVKIESTACLERGDVLVAQDRGMDGELVRGCEYVAVSVDEDGAYVTTNGWRTFYSTELLQEHFLFKKSKKGGTHAGS